MRYAPGDRRTRGAERKLAMKKSGESKVPRKRTVSRRRRELTIGIDLGDKVSRYCVLDDESNVRFERSAATSKKGLAQAFGSVAASRIALEVGTHSPWVKRLLESWNHEVIVANARRVKLITESTRKDDRMEVKLQLSVEEAFLTTRGDDARVRIRTAADANGRIVAKQATIHLNTGAYAENSPIVSRKAAN